VIKINGYSERERERGRKGREKEVPGSDRAVYN